MALSVPSTVSAVAALSFPAELYTKHWYVPASPITAEVIVTVDEVEVEEKDEEDISVPLWYHLHVTSRPLAVHVRVELVP